jgi:parallel beta-helix repeat protein
MILFAVAFSGPAASALVGVAGSTLSCPVLRGPVVYIDPTASSAGNGSLTRPFNSWSDVQVFVPGTTYLQRAGTTDNEALTIANSGTATDPVVVGSYGRGAQPIISQGINVYAAQYVDICGISSTNVVVMAACGNILFHGNTVSQSSGLGIWVGSASTGGIQIDGNIVKNNGYDGIGVDHTNTTAQDQIYVTNNFAINNGAHGIELSTDYVTVKDNIFVRNGVAMSGTSDIHTFAAGPSDDAGNYNTITGNVTLDEVDTQAQDGNGIELDQWTHGNTVSNNLSLNNDGAGIVLYDSGANTIVGNITHNNGLDPGHTHSYRGELVLNAANNLTTDNMIAENVFLSDQSGSPAVNIENIGTPPALSGNKFAKNVYQNSSEESIFDIDGAWGTSLNFWNSTMDAADTLRKVPVADPGTKVCCDYVFPPNTIWTINNLRYEISGWSGLEGLVGRRID